MTPIQLVALNFVAERQGIRLRDVGEPMRQRLIDLGMMEPPLINVDGEVVAVTDVGRARLNRISR